eukprot:scaffold411478_cov17-Prasinocladus_malaysianus.AAC.1
MVSLNELPQSAKDWMARDVRHLGNERGGVHCSVRLTAKLERHAVDLPDNGYYFVAGVGCTSNDALKPTLPYA